MMIVSDVFILCTSMRDSAEAAAAPTEPSASTASTTPTGEWLDESACAVERSCSACVSAGCGECGGCDRMREGAPRTGASSAHSDERLDSARACLDQMV
jgi:hypothetical protein